MEPVVLNVTMDKARGGRRENAGRKSAFPRIDMKPFAMDFTPRGRAELARLERSSGLSRNNIITHLTAMHAGELEFDEEGIVFPGKKQKVLSIRMPPREGELLRAAHARTGKSYSDLGEALVLRYGSQADFPTIERQADKPRRRRRNTRRRA